MALPITNPVVSFGLIILIILVAPLVLRMAKIPGLVGLILAGTVVGPTGLHLLARDASFTMFGTVGLLYIMFQAGLELDMNEFAENRNRSISFGILSFALAEAIGTLAGIYLLGFSLPTALLFAAMMASYTLIAYPIASHLGITKNEAVTVAVGAIIVTDTLALLVLAVMAAFSDGAMDWLFAIRMIVSLTLLILFAFLVVPRIAGWFFRKLESEGVSQYLFVLVVVFALSFGAEAAKIEPIIGAFFAGLALNRLIPENSALMNRIQFVGNAIFIPFFLISVGMLIDFHRLFGSTGYLPIAFVMVGFTIVAKFAAAALAKFQYKYTWNETMVVFGLSIAHAAATLAVVLVGMQLKFFNEDILNATMVLILLSCVASSFIVEFYGRRLVIQESKKRVSDTAREERILIPISNPNTIERMLDLAVMLSDSKTKEPLFTLAVVNDAKQSDGVARARKMLEKAETKAAEYDRVLRVSTRIHYNIPEGILNAAKELLITSIVLGWNGKISAFDRIFGSVLDQVIKKCQTTLLVSKIESPLNVYKNIQIVLAENAEFEAGFQKFLKTVGHLSKQLSTSLSFFGVPTTLNAVKEVDFSGNSKKGTRIEFQPFDIHELEELCSDRAADSLLVVFGAHKRSVSFTPFMNDIPKILSRTCADSSFIIYFPQAMSSHSMLENQDDYSELLETFEIPRGFRKVGAWTRRLFRRKKMAT